MKILTQKIPFIARYDNRSFLVDSSNREIAHLVDFDGFDGHPVYCSCEAFTKGKQRPCKHIKLIMSAIKKIDPCITTK